MIVKADIKRVLCFGGSNLWGYDYRQDSRFPAEVRWTGVLQNRLKEHRGGYEILEEGLNGRTVATDDPDMPGSNGMTYMLPCLKSQNPLDLVVLLLGTNDLKITFRHSAKDVAKELAVMVETIQEHGKTAQGTSPEVLPVSPIPINPDAPDFAAHHKALFDDASVHESRLLAAELSQVADEKGIMFLDAGTIAPPGGDGVHLDQPGHHMLGMRIALKLSTVPSSLN